MNYDILLNTLAKDPITPDLKFYEILNNQEDPLNNLAKSFLKNKIGINDFNLSFFFFLAQYRLKEINSKQIETRL
ncbi:MAG: hypothetical protein AB7V50_09230, partial [Vampirovibrionia bacterium]